jgi:hypothetical protein
MGERRVVGALVALLAAIMFAVSGCGPSGGGAKPSGSDSDEPAPAEAQDAIVKGLQTMFTWYPVRDASPRDAYARALPYLGQTLQAGKDNTIDRGNSVWWQEWKSKQAEVTATALLVAGEHPADQPDTVQRSVLVTQTIKAPDGKELDSTTMLIDRVVAKKSPQGWRVEEINFFPENQYRTQVCPPGQSHQPAPDGPCAPNPPPPPKQCADGTTVPADQTCPAPVTVPSTTQCPDGTTVPSGAACPGPTTTKTTHQCPDGSTIPTDQACPTTPGTTSQPPKPCPDGTTVPADQTCPTPVTKECPGGTTATGTETCPPPTTCGDGSTVYAPTTCPSPTTCGNGSTVYAPTTCPSPTTCSDGSTVYAPTTCPPPPVKCADGSTVPNGQTCPPVKCPDGTSVPNGQTCPPVNCPNGTTVPNGQTCPPVILERPAPAPAFTCSPGGGIAGPSCSCPQGWDYVGGNDGSNGKCVTAGPGPVVHFAPPVGATSKTVVTPDRDVRIAAIGQSDGRSDPCATGEPRICVLQPAP